MQKFDVELIVEFDADRYAPHCELGIEAEDFEAAIEEARTRVPAGFSSDGSTRVVAVAAWPSNQIRDCLPLSRLWVTG